MKNEWEAIIASARENIRIIILKPDNETGTIFVDIVDFRGSVYR